MDSSVTAYLVTAHAPDGAQVSLGPMSISAAISEASKLTANGFANPIIRLMGSSYEVDMVQFMKDLNEG